MQPLPRGITEMSRSDGAQGTLEWEWNGGVLQTEASWQSSGPGTGRGGGSGEQWSVAGDD